MTVPKKHPAFIDYIEDRPVLAAVSWSDQAGLCSMQIINTDRGQELRLMSNHIKHQNKETVRSRSLTMAWLL